MPNTNSGPRMLRGDEAQIYETHHARLDRHVRGLVTAPDAVIQDACAFAWLQFLRCQPDRATVGPWLRTVAVRQAWALAERDRREISLSDAPDPPAGPRHAKSLDETVNARAALTAVSDLPAGQRDCLRLLISGHSRSEIAASTERSLRSVDRQLGRARRHLRSIPLDH